MNKPLRVLIVEDSENDALLLLRELRRGGYDPIHLRVFTAEAMAAALDKQEWDIVFSDYVMPAFSGLKALGITQQKNPELPFLVVSGQIGEDEAVTAMKAGAQDYIMKGNLKRLVPAVERELADAVVRKLARDADELLHKTSERLKLVTDTIQDVFWIMSPEGKDIIYLSPAFDSLWGFPRENAYASRQAMLDGVHPADRQRLEGLAQKRARGQQYEEEYRIVRPDGSVRWVRDRGYPVHDNKGRLASITGVTTDITELQAVNRALMTLTRCNEALVRCATEEDLLQAICHAVIEAGGYRMCWVGYVDESKQKAVKPMSWAGHEEGYLSTLSIDLPDRKMGRGPTGVAM
ncbi:MAG: PAS domain-containing protein, partial [Dehalococcoidia bacterium]|nr:PAS domain-containing protein [Dehalococcoidia bacterium]